MKKSLSSIFITGGAGYVGSVLVPILIKKGYKVTVLDLFLYGKQVFDSIKEHPNLTLIEGDIRNTSLIRRVITNHKTVIHLACISNDPSFELDPLLGKSINFSAFEPLVKTSKEKGVERFIYASSSSVYGIKKEDNVTEDLILEPLTDYSKYKALCEDVLKKYENTDFSTLIVRPATVCGSSPRLRLDLTVNILTNHAYYNRKIRVFGGVQKRPNIHILDMARFYLRAIEEEKEKISGKIYNVGYENHSINSIAKKVQSIIGPNDVSIEKVPTADLRSYHISSKKAEKELGFTPLYSIENAIHDLHHAFEQKIFEDTMNNPLYYNIKTMQELCLK